ncbi:Aste57867_8212 [Aphanomyces stellatus]|uniref:Aste57867_8212 protein n=1 Tax=Aphanomyces stellatus TaxID=120398 RepID=A0A485KJM8_9STRA|nr:hypothetical protein As57867_008181 [Aphanomyces stellatus]VFT85099.1 Aste57867_8212 [Aphanomyces stellatus]
MSSSTSVISSLFQRAQSASTDALHRLLATMPPPLPVAPTLHSVFLPLEAIVSPTHRDNHVAAAPSSETSFLMTQGISVELALLVAGFLDGTSLGSLMATNTTWRRFVLAHDRALWSTLARRELGDSYPSSSPPSSSHRSHYVEAFARMLVREHRHMTHIYPLYDALEAYCRAHPSDHGILGMFSDICYFEDVRVGDAIAKQRFGAMGMVIVQRPSHVAAFRAQSSHVGPVNFVPLENPHWPAVELPPCAAPGFLGYAFDLVRMVPGFEHVKSTVVRAILKHIMVFDTDAAARAAACPAPYVALDDVATADDAFDLCFAMPLRTEMTTAAMKRHRPVPMIAERTHVLKTRLANAQHALVVLSQG